MTIKYQPDEYVRKRYLINSTKTAENFCYLKSMLCSNAINLYICYNTILYFHCSSLISFTATQTFFGVMKLRYVFAIT